MPAGNTPGKAAITDHAQTATNDRSILDHPRGLAYIAFTEAWERFSFYGMQALLVLYMARYLLQPGQVEAVVGFDSFRLLLESVFGSLSTRALATQIFGLYIGLVYFTPVLGGLIGDRLLGRTRAVLCGAGLMAAGHFLMAFEQMFLFALSALVAGSGLLKGNLAAQVGDLYDKDDKRRDGAFLIYNVAILVGGFVAPLVCGTLGELYGWHYGFTAAGIGMLVSIVIYLSGLSYLPKHEMRRGQRSARLDRGDWRVIGGLLCLYLIGTLFWVSQTQVWNSYPLWISARVDRDVFGLTFPVTWFQSIDMFAVLICAPFVLRYWEMRRSDRPLEQADLRKVLGGCVLFASACVLLALGELVSGASKVAFFWPATFHFICAVGFLSVGPVMMSLISRSAPPSINAMMVGGYYLSIFAGSLCSGWLGRFYEAMSPAAFWMMHAAITASGAGLIAVFFGPLQRSLRSNGSQSP